MPPQVSVVIPTYNRAAQLRRVLAGLEKQSCPNDIFEVIVVCDGAADASLGQLWAMDTPLNCKSSFKKDRALPRRGIAASSAHAAILSFFWMTTLRLTLCWWKNMCAVTRRMATIQ